MNIGALRIGMSVAHPNYGVGVVRGLTEHTAEIDFNEGRKTIAPETSEMEPAQAQAALSGMDMPLEQLIEQVVQKMVRELRIEKPESVVEQIGSRWHRGRMVLHPSDTTLQTKELPIEVFFHKIVMMRNNLRVLEQKINGHAVLSDAEKFEFQQYITKCYGSMTTFNLLFKHKEGHFESKST